MPWPQAHPHFDVMATFFVLAFGYWYAETRLRALIAPTARKATGSQWVMWYAGALTMFAVSSWPIHDVGETALFSVHMVEHMVIVFISAPLLLMGMPRWMADVTIGRPSIARWIRPLARPVPAFIGLNVALIAIHWPEAVEAMLTNSLAHFAIHVGLFVTAVLAWLPVRSPTPAIPRMRPPMQMVYLFLHSLLPTVPASFLTFSSVPLYAIYGDASLAWGVSPVDDQTIAGIIMKIGGGVLLWSAIAVIWFRWVSEERRWDAVEADLRSSPTR